MHTTDPKTACTRLMERTEEMGQSNKARISDIKYRTPERRKSFVVDAASYTKYLDDISPLKYFDPQGVFVSAEMETKKIGDLAIDVVIRKIERDQKERNAPIPTHCLSSLIQEAANFVEKINHVVD